MGATGRLGYVDWVKGTAILLVVFGHGLQSCGLTDDCWLFRWIYSFHMPLFMLVSGFVCRKDADWDLCGRRAAQLLVPFFSCAVLGGMISHWDDLGFGVVAEHVAQVVKQPDMGLWFLWVLFFINVLFVGCRKLGRMAAGWLPGGRHELAAEAAVVVAVGGALNLAELATGVKLMGFHWIAWYFLYFAIGVYLRRALEGGMRRGVEDVLRLGCTVAFVAMVPFFRLHNEAPTFYEYVNLGPLGVVAYRLVIGFVGSVMVLLWLKYVGEKGVRMNALLELGGVTLGIYYFHFFVLHIVEKHVEMLPLWGQVAVVSVVTLGVSWLVVIVCRRMALTRVLCLGLPWRERRASLEASRG